MHKRIGLLFSTIRYLKYTQIKYQLLYRLRKSMPFVYYKRKESGNEITFLNLTKQPPVSKYLTKENCFEFLNISHCFNSKIDWDFQAYGKLWNYNLQYFNFLSQNELSRERKLELIHSFYDAIHSNKPGLEPYPVSLRSINIIRFLSEQRFNESRIIENLYAELNFLSQRPEYHLLGNHLLENGFALMMGGVFFNNQNWLQQAEKILKKELNEQILSDGGHFELSPMYHQIILFRVLELIDWYGKYSLKNTGLEKFFIEKAEKMCSWLQLITFKNNEIPLFNDSAKEISFDSGFLLSYAKELGLGWKLLDLGESGYRAFDAGNYECRLDVGKLGPDYQPGHAHSDALSFVLNVNHIPVLVERGTSTYEPNEIRQTERSTPAHNTVTVEGENQSEVYDAFRVGRRAQVKIITDGKKTVVAEHDGYYQRFGLIHQRGFEFDTNKIIITDRLSKPASAEAYFHFYPDLEIKVDSEKCEIFGICSLIFSNHSSIELFSYNFAESFNQYKAAKAIKVSFEQELKTQLTITKLTK